MSPIISQSDQNCGSYNGKTDLKAKILGEKNFWYTALIIPANLKLHQIF
jgi:hypothetical protein